jgi:hypothetical protein
MNIVFFATASASRSQNTHVKWFAQNAGGAESVRG